MLRNFAMQRKNHPDLLLHFFPQLAALLLIFIYFHVFFFILIFFLHLFALFISFIFNSILSLSLSYSYLYFSTWLHCFLSSSQQLQQGHSIEVRTPLKHSKYLANTQSIPNIWHIHKIFKISGKYTKHSKYLANTQNIPNIC